MTNLGGRGLLTSGLLALVINGQASTLGFSWDNDLFVGTDKNYTNGVRVSWVGEAHQRCKEQNTVTCQIAKGVSLLPGVSLSDTQHALTVSLQQIMLTPQNISRKEPDFDALPYVGYSNLELGLFSWDNNGLFGYGIRAGIVGEDSGAEETQKIVHRITGSEPPRGWDNQLGHDTIGGVYLFNAHRAFRHVSEGGYETELGYAWGVDANNFNGTARAGGFIRFGRNLPRNFIPDYAGVGTAGSLVGLFDGNGFGWETFFGVSADYIGYSYLEKNSGPYDVEVRRGVMGLITGTGFHNDNWSVTLTVQGSTSQLRHDDDVLGFGNLSLMWRI